MFLRLPFVLIASAVLPMSFADVAAQDKKVEPRLGLYKMTAYSVPPTVGGKIVPIVNEYVFGELELLPDKKYKVWTVGGKAGGNMLGEGTYDLNADGNLVWKTGHYKGYNPATFKVIGNYHQLQITPRGYARNELATANDAEDKAVKFVEGLKGTVRRHDTKSGKQVGFVDLRDTKVTDADLKELAPLTGLEELQLTGTQVTDDGLKHLAPLKNLTILDLSNTQVTGAGLEHLTSLKNLAVLGLGGPKVTDVGLKHLAPLAKLTSLSLIDTRVTDDGLKHLVPLMNLTYLNLQQTHVTDGGLEHLTSLKNLNTLTLNKTKVTDEGLKHLTSLKNLNTLFLEETKATATGVKELQKVLPNCKAFGVK